MNFKLRNAKEEDLETIYLIEKRTYPIPWTLNFFRLMFYSSSNLFIVASLGKKIIGYIVGNFETFTREKVGHIMNIAVIPSQRDKGVGSMLLLELERRFSKMDAQVAYLEVRESNKRALDLYSKRGYEQVKIVDKYYGHENAIIMTKNLKQ
jgi:ribosomal-protein-alanine N-acetyltransferase